MGAFTVISRAERSSTLSLATSPPLIMRALLTVMDSPLTTVSTEA